MENTMSDNQWKDTFDNLLDSGAKLNRIEKTVRASFNIDSSLENSNYNIQLTEQNKNIYFEDCLKKCYNHKISISTPCHKPLGKQLFNCELSPITQLKLDGFECKSNKVHKSQKPRSNIIKTQLFDSTSQDCIVNLSKLTSNPIPCSEKMVDVMQPSIILKSGKWRKSLNNYFRTQISGQNIRQSGEILQTRKSTIYQGRKLMSLNGFEKNECNCEQEVLKYCGQSNPLEFNTVYAQSKLLNLKKIGEGAYGEVFRYTAKSGTDLVLKIIPIEGSIEINGESQKTFSQILTEIVITTKMSSFQGSKYNFTEGFAKIHKVSLIKGKYPQHFIKLWELYDADKGSENDHPGVLEENQLFAVLELKFAGNEMSNFKFLNAEQSYNALQQIILTLAVGEEEFQFEHRDLHWGNILIECTQQKLISFKFKSRVINLLSKGVQTTIIDYTLSRITIDDCCHFNDLSSDDELFSATGDYQYDIYRMMRNELKNNWSTFSPKTNVLWLSYLIAKLIDGVKYKGVNTKVHRMYIEKLKELLSMIMTFESAAHCAEYLFNNN